MIALVHILQDIRYQLLNKYKKKDETKENREKNLNVLIEKKNPYEKGE